MITRCLDKNCQSCQHDQKFARISSKLSFIVVLLNPPVNGNGNDSKRGHVGCHTWESLDQPETKHYFFEEKVLKRQWCFRSFVNWNNGKVSGLQKHFRNNNSFSGGFLEFCFGGNGIRCWSRHQHHKEKFKDLLRSEKKQSQPFKFVNITLVGRLDCFVEWNFKPPIRANWHQMFVEPK